MERGARAIIAPLVVVIVVIAAALIAVFYWYQGQNFVISNDAQVTAPMAPVMTLSTGTLVTWNAHVGESVTAGESLGTIQLGAPAAASSADTTAGTTQVNVVAPIAGTVVQNAEVQGEIVTTGTTLAYVANLAAPTITAYIRETAIRNVQAAQAVDVRISAFPGSTFSGTVKEVGLATAATFSLLPAPAQSGDFTKVVQRIPVEITLSNVIGNLAPGESAWVRIHIAK